MDDQNQPTSEGQDDQDKKPKQPMQAYDFFVTEFKQVLQQQYPLITGERQQQAIDKQWKTLSKKLKTPFESMASEDKQRYNRELAQYK